MAIRSEYIKNLVDSTKSLDNQYEEAIRESMKSILGDSAKKEIRQLLKESDDEDEFDEEDVVDTDAEDGKSDGEDTEVWDDLEKCKSADGEYDCTGMDNGKLLQVLKSMGPDDEVRVVSNGDGTATVEVDGELVDGDQEFVIDLNDLEGDGSLEDEDGEIDLIMDDGDDDEIDFDVEVGDDDEEIEECGLNEGNTGNTGYTDDYQRKTAMTTPNNHEPGSKTTRSDKFDSALPQGTEKRWANRGDNSPYNQSVNEAEGEGEEEPKGGGPVAVNPENSFMPESTLYEVELDETEGARPNWNSTRKTLAKDNEGDEQFPRSGSKNGKRVKGTGYSVYSGVQKESKSFKQEMDRLYEENRQMKAIIPELQKRVEESIVINASMGYIVKLLNENTTTVDEKQEISRRFGEVSSLNECKKLYETISNELKSVGKSGNIDSKINGQLAEGKQSQLVETTMYKSEAVNQTLDFMKRLNAIP